MNSSIWMVGEIKIDAQHVGKQANLLVVGGYKPFGSEAIEQFYTLNAEAKVVQWDLNLATLEAFKTDITLTKKQQIEIYQGHFLAAGHLRVFFGYQLTNGVVVFNGSKSIDVVITQE